MDYTIEYIKEIEPEMHWWNDELNLFLYSFQVEDFMDALRKDSESIFDDGGLIVHMTSRYIIVDLAEVFQFFGEDPEQLVSKKDRDANV